MNRRHQPVLAPLVPGSCWSVGSAAPVLLRGEPEPDTVSPFWCASAPGDVHGDLPVLPRSSRPGQSPRRPSPPARGKGRNKPETVPAR